MAKAKHHTPEQIIALLRQAEVELAGGPSAPQVCRTLGVSEQTCYRWRKENGDVESFNGKVWDELLNPELFDTLLEAKVLTGRWRRAYNTVRPHSSLEYRPPAPEVVLAHVPGSASPAGEVEKRLARVGPNNPTGSVRGGRSRSRRYSHVLKRHQDPTSVVLTNWPAGFSPYDPIARWCHDSY